MTGAVQPMALLAALADDDRIKVLGAVALGSDSVPAVVAATGLTEKVVRRAIGRLSQTGLVASEGPLAVDAGVFSEALKAEEERRRGPGPEAAGATPEQAAVIRNFWADGRITTMPIPRAKRLVVLDFVASRFEPGKVYPERDVNLVLGKLFSDHAALRRYLVDEGFLERRDGFYWRAGGTFDID